MLSVICGEEGCECGGVNCGSDGVLCSACGVVGGAGVPFGSSGSVGGIGGGEMEAGATVELVLFSSVHSNSYKLLSFLVWHMSLQQNNKDFG